MNTEPQVCEIPQPARGKVIYSGLSGETRLRYIAHSILHGVVDQPEVPTLNEARDIISWAKAAA